MSTESTVLCILTPGWFMKLVPDTVKKSFSIFPTPAGMSLTKLSLEGNYDVIYKFFPPRESLVSDIPAAGTGISKSFFYG
jgi:hypothetical protein